jgi:hypothetical protein
VAAVNTTGKIRKRLITVAGTMDPLLPTKTQARAYEVPVNASSQCIARDGAIVSNPAQRGHCADLYVH